MLSGSNLVIALAFACFSTQTSAGPCDIYAAGGTPCVAAHSTTRALYDKYFGPLYAITRGSDNSSINIKPRSPGGVANAPTQESFCTGTTCTITTIFDQSSNHNDLHPAPPGAFQGPGANNYDIAASAFGAPVTLNGQCAYGVFIEPTSGYRNDVAVGTAKGDEPQGMYAIFDGTHYNNRCCFDYGNAETNDHDTGNGHMEAIYFGSDGAGKGKEIYIQADLENGLFASGNSSVTPQSISYQFVTAIVKGKPGTWAIRGGNAASGPLSTFWDGPRPQRHGYNPMKKEGAIILGIGGDNSFNAQGTFYEGVMTSGYPDSATEDAVQANIVSAGYAQAPLVSGPVFTPGSVVTLRATTDCCTRTYIIHDNSTAKIHTITSSSPNSLKQQANWKVVTGLGNSNCYSFESVDTPGSYLRQSNFEMLLNPNDQSKSFAEDATYCPQVGLNRQEGASSIRSWNHPTRFLRHYGGVLYLAANGGPGSFDTHSLYNNDTSFVMGSGF